MNLTIDRILIATTALCLGIFLGLRFNAQPHDTTPEKQVPVTIDSRSNKAFTDERELQQVTTNQGKEMLNDLNQAIRANGALAKKEAIRRVLAKANLENITQFLAWANSLEESSEKTILLRELMERFGEIDPFAAAALALESYEQGGNLDFLYCALTGWAKKDPMRALAKLESMPLSNEPKLQIQRRLVAEWVNLDASKAAAYAQAHRDPNDSRGLVVIAADEWAKIDPVKAVQWVGTLESGLDKMWATDRVVQNWAQIDPDAAAAFATSLQPGESRDLIIGSLANQFSSSEPDVALKWTELIDDANIQSMALAGVLGKEFIQNKEQAMRRLRKTQIHVEVQNRALDQLKKSYE